MVAEFEEGIVVAGLGSFLVNRDGFLMGFGALFGTREVIEGAGGSEADGVVKSEAVMEERANEMVGVEARKEVVDRAGAAGGEGGGETHVVPAAEAHGADEIALDGILGDSVEDSVEKEICDKVLVEPF